MLRYTRKEHKQAAKNDLSHKWGVSIGSFLMATYLPLNIIVFPFAFFYMGMLFGFLSEAVVYSVLSIVLMNVALWGSMFFIYGPLYMGYYMFVLRLSRGQEVYWSMPYRCFTSGVFGRYVKGYFMYNLYIILWSLLFVIPGIIKMLSYAMMPYLLVDHPEMTWKEAMQESMRMMHGHKWDLFVLTLSFFWWFVLAYLTSSISMVYSGPYMEQAFINFYRDLKGETLNVAPVASYEMPH